MRVFVLNYIGNDNFARPVYGNGNNLFVDVDPREYREPKICTKLNNCFDGEPDTPIKYMEEYKDMEVLFFPKRIIW